MGGVALIKVGAATETEMKEKKVRVEDTMHVTKAAAEEGNVPGGEVALCIVAQGGRGAPSVDRPERGAGWVRRELPQDSERDAAGPTGMRDY